MRRIKSVEIEMFSLEHCKLDNSRRLRRETFSHFPANRRTSRLVNDFINELNCFNLRARVRFVIRNTVIYEIAYSLTSTPAHPETFLCLWREGEKSSSLETMPLSLFFPLSLSLPIKKECISTDTMLCPLLK